MPEDQNAVTSAGGQNGTAMHDRTLGRDHAIRIQSLRSGRRPASRSLAYRFVLSCCIAVSLLGFVLPSIAVAPRALDASAVPAATSIFYGSADQPDTLNPLRTQTDIGRLVDSAVFDSLLRPDPHNALQPSLASSWTESLDGRTWTFNLRHHIRWADGIELT